MTLRAILDTIGIATAGQNCGAVKIMTLHHNFDWRKCEKKKSGKRKMDLLKYKLKINHSTLCVRLPKDQCHTQLKVFTDQYNWISVSLKIQICARQEKRGFEWGFGNCNSRGACVWGAISIFFLLAGSTLFGVGQHLRSRFGHFHSFLGEKTTKNPPIMIPP